MGTCAISKSRDCTLLQSPPLQNLLQLGKEGNKDFLLNLTEEKYEADLTGGGALNIIGGASASEARVITGKPRKSAM